MQLCILVQVFLMIFMNFSWISYAFRVATVFQDVCIKQCFIRFHVMKRVENINIISFVVLSNALAILLYSSFISIAMHYYQIAVILPLKFKQFFFLDFLIKLYTETFMIWVKNFFWIVHLTFLFTETECLNSRIVNFFKQYDCVIVLDFSLTSKGNKVWHVGL